MVPLGATRQISNPGRYRITEWRGRVKNKKP